MQKVLIPVTLNPARCAQRHLTYEGTLPSKVMKRVNGASAGDCKDLDVSVECGVDVQGIVYLSGKAVTELTLICQRCMEPVKVPVAVEFAFSPVTDDSQIDELPDAYEPVELDENGEVMLHQLIEDEILVAFPIVPSHDTDSCNLASRDVTVGKIAEPKPADERPKNPFAVLETLKRN
ncbi:23S rRNA accumulation protein YceD [Ferrimonas lipolytica]|uniref:Large ribosomal RNA subunit accumulation protein YceD n=1 Tax=Ferrimonas lipolytica TaxID=2724191 RepID=A0A6H1UCW3_9GAMM|nr:23S rRNA accumulation protein YceD [Ferrimonas lipolytica]QIZ76046.1 23S rRNA accumulation protein YceD [Ferrimonas lipolytica]